MCVCACKYVCVCFCLRVCLSLCQRAEQGATNGARGMSESEERWWLPPNTARTLSSTLGPLPFVCTLPPKSVLKAPRRWSHSRLAVCNVGAQVEVPVTPGIPLRMGGGGLGVDLRAGHRVAEKGQRSSQALDKGAQRSPSRQSNAGSADLVRAGPTLSVFLFRFLPFSHTPPSLSLFLVDARWLGLLLCES